MPRIAKTEEKKTTAKKAVVHSPKAAGLTVPVFSLDGKEAGQMTLPKDVFGAKVNKPLMSQALRVYLNNLKSHWSNTKTRGEVDYSTRKLGAQKGSGHARHGSLGAPIYVGGGIALGPKFRKVVLDLPKKMKKAALLSALSLKASSGDVFGVSGLEKAGGKTSQMKKFLESTQKRNMLLIIDGKNDKVAAAVRNLPEIDLLSFDQLNTLNVIGHESLVITKEAVEKLQLRANKEEIK